ncbi:MAG: MASE1 domain-containing protein [Luteimonas sp.]
MSERLGWLEKEFRLSLRPNGLLLAVAYAVCFWAARQISADQWYLPAGLRVAALLLFPYRYWPYLIAGEYSAFAYLRYPLMDDYGMAWAIGASVMLIPTVAYIVYKHERLRSSSRHGWFFSVAALAAVSVTVLNIATTHFLMSPAGETVSWEKGLRFMIGDYIGILMLAPLALLWKQRKLADPVARKLHWDTLIALALIALFGAYVAQSPDADSLQANSLRVLMVLPAIVLTCLYGWRGAVIGVAALNLIIGLTMARTDLLGAHDAQTFIVQEILAVTGTALLALGSTISQHYHKLRDHRLIEQRAVTMARTSALVNEQEMRERAAQMKTLGEDIDLSFRNAVQWLQVRGHQSVAAALQRSSVAQSRLFREQLSLVYPAEIEHYGLYLVLQSSGIAAAWEHTARLATPQLTGDPCQLSLDLQLAAYRSLCEAVTLLLECESGSILIRARCGRRGAHRGIVLSVSFQLAFKLSLIVAISRAESILGATHMARPRRVDSDLVAQAQAAVMEATDLETLRRAQAVLLPALLGATLEQTAAVLGVGRASVPRLQARLRQHSAEPATARPGWGGRRRAVLTPEEERSFLAPWAQACTAGGILVVSPLRAALAQQLGRPVAASIVYRLLARHGWRKVAPDTRHPKSDPRAQEAWKKNSPKCWQP